MPDSSETPESSGFPVRGRLLGIDFGTKRLGLAICNPEQTISSPLENYTRRDAAQDAKHVRRLVEEERIVGLVIGLPVHMSGDEGGKAIEARAFGDWIAAETKLPVKYWDERYTSLQAEQMMLSAELTPKQRKARRDMLAAQILLRDFLNGDRQATSFGRLA
ncbi:MAG: Holliday junction resolvase RuvX [Planctomycetales bacterium]|nr:Holliday junction resolvase RuvX [Planctomycetales bacterium]